MTARPALDIGRAMKVTEINIRDPYVLYTRGKYYLYGTRSATCWGVADGFDCYISEDFESWDGPFEIFHKPEGFFADRFYWAPECYEYEGFYYLVTTFGSKTVKKGIYILKSDRPEGPFELYSEKLTPTDWTSIDGTLYFQDNRKYLIFSHSFEDTPDGDMCVIELTADMRQSVGQPLVLFSAISAPWARPVPFAEAEFGMKGNVYFTDGPCVFHGKDGRLYMLWSSWSTRGYAVGTAVSDSGEITGIWKHLEEPVFPENGGHGMMFYAPDGTMKYVLHYPNDKYQERPVFCTLEITDGKVVVTNGNENRHE